MTDINKEDIPSRQIFSAGRERKLDGFLQVNGKELSNSLLGREEKTKQKP